MSHETLYKIEQEYWNKNLLVCGVDEVGRGCLAGPVVTAAAILQPGTNHPLLIDSKKLSPEQLITMYEWLLPHCTYAIGINSAQTIDKYNIYQATAITMRQSLINLFATKKELPSIILIDAMPLSLQATPYHAISIQSFTQGESKSTSIAAASIIAKVTRDRIISRMHTSFPSYHLATHKGYATTKHYKALHEYQASIIHRQTFLKKILKEDHREQQTIFC